MTEALIMLVCGLATHFIKDIIRISIETKKKPTPLQYWKAYPYQTAISIIGAIAGFIALDSTGQLTPLAAFGIGYVANSVADMIGKRSLDKI